jgi:O-antigen ligase
MTPAAPAETTAGRLLRISLLVLLGVAPLLAGAVHEVVFVPLLVGCAAAGLAAWKRSRWGPGRSGAERPLPAWRLLLGLQALALLQLVPMPPALLRRVSPGSFSFYNDPLLVPLTGWKPVSVSPADTLRGLAFLAAFSLLYLAVFRELAADPWRRRLMLTVVGAGLVMTVVALLQAVSPEPRKIYGLWRPRWDWGVFGPYVNRNHFAGYLVMASLLCIGFVLEAWARLRRRFERRRRHWLSLGEEEGTAAIRASVVAMVLFAGLLASASRGGVAAFALAALVLPLASRHRGRTVVAVAVPVGIGIAWIGLGGLVAGFEARGIRASRLDLWRDMLPMIPRFPVFGVGWNAFSTAYPWYQTVLRTDWVGEAHNDYLQVLLDGGLVAAVVVALLLVRVFRSALARAATSPLDLGLFGALLGLALHNLVDFNWQIPANAATWVALAALAVTPLPGAGGGKRPSRLEDGREPS